MPNSMVMGIEQVLSVMLAEPAEPDPQLRPLFLALVHGDDAQIRADAERRIWDAWSDHVDAQAARLMRGALAALDRGALEHAERQLSAIVERWPEWAEAWNKRATVRFMAGHDAGSLADIARTLTLEPRHFGALSGFGQICMRANDPASALLAFEHALAINPNWHAIRDAADTLRSQRRQTLH